MKRGRLLRWGRGHAHSYRFDGSMWRFMGCRIEAGVLHMHCTADQSGRPRGFQFDGECHLQDWEWDAYEERELVAREIAHA